METNIPKETLIADKNIRDVVINTDDTPAPKNVRGELGKICNNCGGFGFTLNLGGASNSKGCQDCNQTGVATMTNAELQEQVVKISSEIHELKNLIIKLAQEKVENE